MDKFLHLVREYVLAGWRMFARDGWEDRRGLGEYCVVLEETPLNPDDPKVPDGMRYHVIDVYIDELDRVDEKREGAMPIDVVLEPLRKLGRDTLSKVVRGRVEEALKDERLKDWLGSSPDEGSNGMHAEEDEEWNGIED
jgi:ribosomal RNA-processing protein 1